MNKKPIHPTEDTGHYNQGCIKRYSLRSTYKPTQIISEYIPLLLNSILIIIAKLKLDFYTTEERKK